MSTKAFLGDWCQLLKGFTLKEEQGLIWCRVAFLALVLA